MLLRPGTAQYYDVTMLSQAAELVAACVRNSDINGLLKDISRSYFRAISIKRSVSDTSN